MQEHAYLALFGTYFIFCAPDLFIFPCAFGVHMGRGYAPRFQKTYIHPCIGLQLRELTTIEAMMDL